MLTPSGHRARLHARLRLGTSRTAPPPSSPPPAPPIVEFVVDVERCGRHLPPEARRGAANALLNNLPSADIQIWSDGSATEGLRDGGERRSSAHRSGARYCAARLAAFAPRGRPKWWPFSVRFTTAASSPNSTAALSASAQTAYPPLWRCGRARTDRPQPWAQTAGTASPG